MKGITVNYSQIVKRKTTIKQRMNQLNLSGDLDYDEASEYNQLNGELLSLLWVIGEDHKWEGQAY